MQTALTAPSSTGRSAPICTTSWSRSACGRACAAGRLTPASAVHSRIWNTFREDDRWTSPLVTDCGDGRAAVKRTRLRSNGSFGAAEHQTLDHFDVIYPALDGTGIPVGCQALDDGLPALLQAGGKGVEAGEVSARAVTIQSLRYWPRAPEWLITRHEWPRWRSPRRIWCRSRRRSRVRAWTRHPLPVRKRRPGALRATGGRGRLYIGCSNASRSTDSRRPA